MLKPCTATILLTLTASALANDLQCAVDRRTEAHQCISAAQLRETEGIRWAPLYRGGPRQVNPTSFTAHANCRTQALHLKDRDGVTFSGGRFSDTEMAAQLGGILCESPLPTPRKPRKP